MSDDCCRYWIITDRLNQRLTSFKYPIKYLSIHIYVRVSNTVSSVYFIFIEFLCTLSYFTRISHCLISVGVHFCRKFWFQDVFSQISEKMFEYFSLFCPLARVSIKNMIFLNFIGQILKLGYLQICFD